MTVNRPGGDADPDNRSAPAPPGRSTDGSIRVLLADDQALIRSALADLISHEPGFNVLAQAANGQEAYDLTRIHRPDVVLMDVRMPRVDGIRATEMIAADAGLAATRIIILTTFEDDYVLQALRAGASGFIGKGADPADLMTAIRVVHGGEALLSPRATQKLIARYRSDRTSGAEDDTSGAAATPAGASTTSPAATADLGHVTSRELEVLKLVGRGMSNVEIAEHLVISPHTAKTHVSRTMVKLGLRDRAQMVVLAYESGLMTS